MKSLSHINTLECTRYVKPLLENIIMFGRGMKKILIEDVQRLSFSQQKKLHEYARAMMVSRPTGSRGSELLRFSGFFDKKSVREMAQAIRDCEKVDNGEW